LLIRQKFYFSWPNQIYILIYMLFSIFLKLRLFFNKFLDKQQHDILVNIYFFSKFSYYINQIILINHIFLLNQIFLINRIILLNQIFLINRIILLNRIFCIRRCFRIKIFYFHKLIFCEYLIMDCRCCISHFGSRNDIMELFLLLILNFLLLIIIILFFLLIHFWLLLIFIIYMLFIYSINFFIHWLMLFYWPWLII